MPRQDTRSPVNPTGMCKCGCGGIAPLAKQTDRRKGWVRGEPVQFIAGHSLFGRITRNYDADRGVLFDPETGCWNWQGYISHGYGVYYEGDVGRRAHRVYYERYIGPIPDGYVIDHLCRNRRCCNPAHLEPVTSRENIRRGDNTILTVDNVREIKRLRGMMRPRELAARFGVSPRTIQNIWYGVTWRDVESPAA